jgi:phosphonate transport system substrate-binding protein
MAKYHQRQHAWQTILTLFVIFVFLTACAPQTPTPTPTIPPTQIPEVQPTPIQTPTPRPSPTPTLPPLGSMGNPITIGFVPPHDELGSSGVEDLVSTLADETNYVIEAFFYPDFQALSTAILNGEVHLFWLRPFEYLYLNREGVAEVMLMSNHLGVYAYGVQFMSNINRGFTPYFDPETSQSIGDPINALQQFSGTRPCFIDPNSIPGYYVPLGLLANASTPTLAPVFTYSYNAVIRALYIQGICDFGVSFALTGDPLTSSDIMQNLPEAQEQIIIIWQSEGIIPNLNLSASPTLPVFIRFRLEEALIRISESPQGLSLISTALNYDVEALRSVEDHLYNPLRSAIAPLELDLETIIFQPFEP